jgi:uncharacterized protein (TIGR01777 family)
MTVLVTGGKGFIGRAVVLHLKAMGHRVLILTRSPKYRDEIGWDPIAKRLNPDDLKDIHAVVHLAGESIGSGLWTQSRKTAIYESRVLGTRLLADTFLKTGNLPSVFIGASAIGFYGYNAAGECDESSPKGEGFLATVCSDWEEASLVIERLGVRRVILRFGHVLERGGGLLKAMIPAHGFGIAWRLGNGTQCWPWIGLMDLQRLILFSLQNPEIKGVYNAVAPELPTQMIFSKKLAGQRSVSLPIPSYCLNLLSGNMGQELFLAHQKVVSKRLGIANFSFTQTLNDCLRV